VSATLKPVVLEISKDLISNQLRQRTRAIRQWKETPGIKA